MAQIRIKRGDTLQRTLTLTSGGTPYIPVGATIACQVKSAATRGEAPFVDSLTVTRSATTALAASATPTVITTTNLPGAVAFTMGLDASGVGIDKDITVDFGDSGFAANAVGTATTVVCPVLAGAIWRVNVFYRLGV